MNPILQELAYEFPGTSQFARVALRLLIAALLGSVVGIQRERSHKAAGLRTHMLVALGSAVFTIVPLEGGASEADVTRVIQGIAAGVGFLGGGVILKLPEHARVHGLTTAAGIWL